MANRKRIAFSSNVRWLIPFVRAAKPLIPYQKLKRVHGYHLSTRMGVASSGTITRNTTGHFKISIPLNDYSIHRPRDSKRAKIIEVVPNYTWEILSSLAHELAHMVHWEHTPAHMRLEARLMIRFANTCVKLKITDLWSERRDYVLSK